MSETRTTIHTPPEAAQRTIKRIKDVKDSQHRSMPFFVEKIRGYFADLMPGDTCGVLAQTHNYKTGAMTYWEWMLARHLKEQGREDEVIFHVDLENTVESLGMQEVARYSNQTVYDLSRGNVGDWGAVVRAADKIADVEIYRICDRLGSDDLPDLYLSNIYRSLDYAVSGKLLGRSLKPAAIFLDYLQALPIDPEVKKGVANMKEQRRLQVREDAYRIRRMANYFECPVIVGIQAKQTLTGHGGKNMMLPGIYDGEETSAIGQRFDRLISLWMPKVTHTVNEYLKHGDIHFTVEENTLWLKVLKQRGGLPSGRSWRCWIDFQSGMVTAN